MPVIVEKDAITKREKVPGRRKRKEVISYDTCNLNIRVNEQSKCMNILHTMVHVHTIHTVQTTIKQCMQLNNKYTIKVH